MSRIEEALFNKFGISLTEAVDNKYLSVIISEGAKLYNGAGEVGHIQENDEYLGNILIKNIRGEDDFLNKVEKLVFDWSRYNLLPQKNALSILGDNVFIEYGEHRRLPLSEFLETKKDFLDSTGGNYIAKNFSDSFGDYNLLEYRFDRGLIRIHIGGEDYYRWPNHKDIPPEEIYSQVIDFLNYYNIKYKERRYKEYLNDWDTIDIKVNPNVFFEKGILK